MFRGTLGQNAATVYTGITIITVRIEATLTCKFASEIYASIPSWTIPVCTTLPGKYALVVFAFIPRWAFIGAAAFTDPSTPVFLAGKPGITVSVGITFGFEYTVSVYTLPTARAIEIRPAVGSVLAS